MQIQFSVLLLSLWMEPHLFYSCLLVILIVRQLFHSMHLFQERVHLFVMHEVDFIDVAKLVL